MRDLAAFARSGRLVLSAPAAWLLVLFAASLAHAEQPPFQARLSDEEYTKQAAQYLKAVADRQKLATDPTPTLGAEIDKLTRTEVSEREGVEPGDFITKVDGRRLWTPTLPWNRESTELEVLSGATGDARHVVLVNERLTARLKGTHRPELGYWRDGRRDPRWDDAVLVGLLARREAPDLAETAWAKAIAAGYQPDAYSAFCGAAINLAMGRSDVAARFASESLTFMKANPENEIIPPQLVARAFLATNQFELMPAIVEAWPNAFEFDADSLKAYAAMIEQRRRVKLLTGDEEPFDPADFDRTAERFHLEDLKPRLVGLTHKTITEMLPTLRRGDVLELAVETDHYYHCAVGVAEPIRRLRIELEIAAKPTDAKEGDYGKSLEVGIAERSRHSVLGPNNLPGFDTPSATLSINQFGDPQLVLGGYSGVTLPYSDPRIKLDGKQFVNVQLTRINDVLEIRLDGRRVLLAPVVSSLSPALYFRVIGMSSQCRKFEVHELIPLAGAQADRRR